MAKVIHPFDHDGEFLWQFIHAALLRIFLSSSLHYMSDTNQEIPISHRNALKRKVLFLSSGTVSFAPPVHVIR